MVEKSDKILYILEKYFITLFILNDNEKCILHIFGICKLDKYYYINIINAY